MKTGTLRTWAVDTLYYIAGSILYALGIYTFALNAGFAPGGISGIAIMVNHFTGLPVGVLSLVLNVPLIIICGKVVGAGFLLKTLYVMVINTLFLDVVFPFFPTYNGSPLLAALFMGVCVGGGIALIYMRGASTGGTDFITMSVKKLRPHMKVGQIALVVDGVIILCGGLVYGNIDAVLYGILASFAFSLTTDNLLYGAGSGKLAIIITSKGQAVADAIMDDVGRGATLVDATGAYSGQGLKMVLCACSKNEIYKVRTVARTLDPGSMVMVSDASEIFGEGFVPPKLPGNEEPASGGAKPGGKATNERGKNPRQKGE